VAGRSMGVFVDGRCSWCDELGGAVPAQQAAYACAARGRLVGCQPSTRSVVVQRDTADSSASLPGFKVNIVMIGEVHAPTTRNKGRATPVFSTHVGPRSSRCQHGAPVQGVGLAGELRVCLGREDLSSRPARSGVERSAVYFPASNKPAVTVH
jgi:hypothetical protein